MPHGSQPGHRGSESRGRVTGQSENDPCRHVDALTFEVLDAPGHTSGVPRATGRGKDLPVNALQAHLCGLQTGTVQ